MASPKRVTEESAAAGPTVFRDTLYTSRVLILPDGRQLPVAKGLVSADPGDTVAQGYLSEHPDLQLQE